MRKIIVGVEKLRNNQGKLISGRRVGLVAHPASVISSLEHTLDVLEGLGAKMEVLFGPEHGFAGEAQDMESVDGVSTGPHGLPLRSLYGATESTLAPTADQISGLDALVVDLADVGSRYYTFVWTSVLCLRACHRAGVEMILTDRPNPIGGEKVEGGLQKPGFTSFVGLVPVANRHGLTVAELVKMVADHEGMTDGLTIVPMEGWERRMYYEDTGLPWILPSPNMPTLDTAIVYPGMCLLEGTTVSEGRGTTRPFEIFGAPGIDGVALARTLTEMKLPGVRFRPLSFKPSFHKHAGRICGGVQIHVVDRESFLSYRTGIAALVALNRILEPRLEWRIDPYEFVTDIPAIDLLTGSSEVRKGIEQGAGLSDLAETWLADEKRFIEMRQEYQMYG